MKIGILLIVWDNNLMVSVSDLISVSEFAKFKGITSQAVRKAIKEYRIEAVKVGCQWVIKKEELRKLGGKNVNKRKYR